MREFKVRNEKKWMHQNEAEYTGAYVEGTLLDSYVLACKRGYAAVYERYVNPNKSEHVYKFAPYSDQRKCDELWAEFMEFEDSVRLAMWMNGLMGGLR